jgi:hypothetical protein
MKTKLYTIIPLLCIIVLLSCTTDEKSAVGTIVHSINGQPVIPFTANKLYIEPLKNETGIQHYGDIITKRIVEKIVANGRLAIATSEEVSDLKLMGTIQSLQIQPITIDYAGIVKKKRLLIIAVISLVNMHTKTFIFRNITVQAFKEYSDIEAPITPLNIVQDEVEQMLASRITLQVETGWYTALKTDAERGKK